MNLEKSLRHRARARLFASFVLRLVPLLFVCLLFSCSRDLGYGVMLWEDEEHSIPEGEIVKVLIRSNIAGVYVISRESSEERLEVPLWKVTDPESRKKAQETAALFADCAHTYASVKLDGLPIRALADNTAKQVYRLREAEIIRVLYKGEGQVVTSGRGNLEGDWYRVLTEGGIQGWCFSYNLNLFDKSQTQDALALQSAGEEESEAQTDAVLDKVQRKVWYPDYFAGMIKAKKIDLARMSASYGFDTGSASQIVRVTLPGVSKTWSYGGITKEGAGRYKFDGIPVQMTVKDENTIVVQYTDDDKKLKSQTFVSLTENIDELVRAEQRRRQNELTAIAQAGPAFKSSNYGTITFESSTAIDWQDYNLLVPSILSGEAGSRAQVSVDYLISDSVKSVYDGVLTFTFEKETGSLLSARRGATEKVNFLYKMTSDGLRLEDTTRAVFEDGIITQRSPSPLVMFFSRY